MKFDDKVFIAKQIRIHRKRAGLTQAELAEKVNLSTQHISRIESGCYIPSLTSFFMIVEVLKIDLKTFGFDIHSTNSKRKDTLINMIANSDESELIFYEDTLDIIKKSLFRLKQEIPTPL